MASVQTQPEGLTRAEAQRRLAQYGHNQLLEKKKLPPWMIFFNQFRDFMILILMAAAVLSGVMGDITDTIIILIIVVLNALIGFIQEYRAEKAMEALKRMSLTKAIVLRDGQKQVLSSLELVPGDIVEIEAGHVVPADIRLTEVFSLRIDESSLTGESVPADKNTELILTEHPSPGDQHNMAFKGTLVTNGRGYGIVVATGMNTQLGKIAQLLQGADPSTPLQARIRRFGKSLSWIVLLICLILFITGVLRGEDPFKILLLSISLAVAAIPEALPALITVVLSMGAARMARHKALVRKLPAVETLGAVTYICSDKTGTLTMNRMSVTKVHEQAPGMEMLLTCMALNHDVRFNDYAEPFGESTELALVQHVLKERSYSWYQKVANDFPRVWELPFDSDRRCMTTVHRDGNRFIVTTKGAAESLAALLADAADAEHLKRLTMDWASQGVRVLAYGYKYLPALPDKFDWTEVESDLLFVGLTGLIDPPREEVKVAIDECKRAGIHPVMITGDHPATAKAIAREIGILDEGGLVMTGAELQQLDEAGFDSQVEKTYVYARVSPDQKLRIVRALQQRHQYVAMTGDGVNDAPALKAANIGVAMGINGTDVSKEAADLILLDDNFATIVKAVKEGRRIFDNIRKFIKYTMTSNAGEIWTIFLAPLVGLPVPLLPVHILWINLVTDGLPGLALANEAAEKNIMNQPPRRPDESIFARGLAWHILWVGLLMGAVCLISQAWALNNNDPKWQTYVFTILCFSQMGHVYAIRSERKLLYKQGLFSNRPLAGAVLLTFLLQLMLLYVPFFQEIFSTQPLTLTELGACIGVSLIVFHAVEVEKWVKRLLSDKKSAGLQNEWIIE